MIIRTALVALILSVSVVVFSEEQQTITILVPYGTDTNKYEKLELAIEAQTSDLPITITTTNISSTKDRLEAAEEFSKKEGSLSVIWLSNEGDELFMLTPRLGGDPLNRKINTDGSWIARCDTMATIIFSEMTAALEVPTVKEIRSIDTDTGTDSEENIATPTVVPPIEKIVETDKRVWLLSRVGYTPLMLSFKGPILHGAMVGIGVNFVKYMEINLSVDIMQSATLESEKTPQAMALMQWPIRIGVAGILPIGNFDLGVGLDTVINVWYIQGIHDAVSSGSEKTHVESGLSLCLKARYKFVPWLAIAASFGTDHYFDSIKYELHEETVLYRAKAQLRSMIGFEFIMAAQ